MSIINDLKAELVKALDYLKDDGKGEKFDSQNLSPEQVNISEYKEGGKVEIVAADGTLSVAPDGDYTLSDGRKFSVKDGLITSIETDVTAENMADATSADAAPEDNAPSIEDVEAQVQALQDEVAGIKQVLEEVINQITGSAKQEDMQKFADEVNALNVTIQKLAKVPVEVSKTNTSNKVKDKTDEKVMDFIKCFKK